MRRLPIMVGAAVTMVVLLALGYGLGRAGQPTPSPTSKPATTIQKPAPTPEPSVVIRTVTEEVAAPACLDAIDSAYAVMLPDSEFVADVLAAYLDFPDETLDQFGLRVETLLGSHSAAYDESLFSDFENDAADCEAAR